MTLAYASASVDANMLFTAAGSCTARGIMGRGSVSLMLGDYGDGGGAAAASQHRLDGTVRGVKRCG